ncbi:uncharacterized protein [Aegilops tauschii subsp. strangulata]|uniref:uncharacterized protein n=1 Tax=Aegilops tauschii subsp. strangulata TaxID=200361 RepID=UPI003CC8CF1A
MPSVALLRHFFFLRVSDGHIFGCANFIASGKANSISSTGKRADNIRAKWVMMDAKRAHPHLVLPMEAPQFNKGWPRAEPADERTSTVLEQMQIDLKPGNAKAVKVTGATLLREFLMLCVAPLQARARPLWKLEDEEEKTRLRPGALPGDELAAILCLIVGDNQEYPPSAFTPLFLRKDWEPLVLSRPTFNARGLVPPALSGAPAALKPMEVSSDESGGGKEEEGDSEATLEEMGENSPLEQS